MENNYQNFRNLCQKAGINIDTISFIAKPDDVFKLYQLTIKECQKEDVFTGGVGWKGKSGINVEPFGENEYKVTEHRKSKTTGEVAESTKIVTKQSINLMLTIIRYLTEKGENRTNYREIIRELKERKRLNVGLDAFNGGINRAKYYFKYYYYPIKVLEYYKYIVYSGGGKVDLIKKEERYFKDEQ